MDVCILGEGRPRERIVLGSRKFTSFASSSELRNCLYNLRIKGGGWRLNGRGDQSMGFGYPEALVTRSRPKCGKGAASGLNRFICQKEITTENRGTDRKPILN